MATSCTAARSRLSAAAARRRAVIRTSTRQNSASSTPRATPADQHQRRHRDAADLRRRRLGQLQEAHHRQRDQPSPAAEGGQDQQPLQQAYGAGPPRDLGDAEVGAGHRRVQPVAEVVEPGRRGAAYRLDPGPAEILRGLVGEVAHLGVDPGALDRRGGRERRAGGAGELLAGRAEVEVEPLERVGPQPRQPRHHRPAGGAAGADPGRPLDRGDHGGHARGVGERVLEGGDPAVRAARAACPGRWPRRPAPPTTFRSASSRVRAAFLAETRSAISARSPSTPRP